MAAVLAEVDQVMSAWLLTIAEVQAAFLAQHGRYGQALWISSETPRDGEYVVPDQIGAHPSDQPVTPLSMLPVPPASTICNVAVDVYASPQGQGYVVRYRIIVAGQEWEKAVAYGPLPMGHEWMPLASEVSE